MAFAKGKETKESSFKRYIGIAPFRVVALNPTKEELSKIYGREVTKDQEYLSKTEVNGVSVDRTRLTFVMQCTLEGFEDLYVNASYLLQNAPTVGSTSGKTQIMDVYGRTAWATKDELDNKAIPQYASGPANISPDYRVTYRGEENLTVFLQKLLQIPSVTKFVNGAPAGLIDNLEDAYSRLENVGDYFKGDITELKDILSYQPNNKVKLLIGLQTDNNNNTYMVVFTDYPMLAGSTNYAKLQAAVEAAQAAGRYANTIFEFVDFKEYVATPTNFSNSTETKTPDNPWFQA